MYLHIHFLKKPLFIATPCDVGFTSVLHKRKCRFNSEGSLAQGPAAGAGAGPSLLPAPKAALWETPGLMRRLSQKGLGHVVSREIW